MLYCLSTGMKYMRGRVLVWLQRVINLTHLSLWCYIRPDSRLPPSQWKTSLQSNVVSHWLGTNLESALCYAMTCPIGLQDDMILLYSNTNDESAHICKWYFEVLIFPYDEHMSDIQSFVNDINVCIVFQNYNKTKIPSTKLCGIFFWS